MNSRTLIPVKSGPARTGENSAAIDTLTEERSLRRRHSLFGSGARERWNAWVLSLSLYQGSISIYIRA